MGASSMRSGNHIDLRTQGGIRTNTVTPGNSVQLIFDPQQSRVGASGTKVGMFNTVRKVVLEGVVTVVRSSGGTTPVYADAFPRALKSIGLTSPMFGTLIDPTVTNGMTAKHVLEYFGTGFKRPGISRQPIPGSDGTYTRTFEIELPFAQGWNINPDHFDPWLGWLDNSILEIFVNDAADPFGVSAGVTITSVALSVIIETVPWPELLIPPYVTLRRYQQAAAAGSNGPKLQNVGDAGALQGVDDGARLLALLFSHQAGGFTGSGTADQVSAVTIPWRDQAQTTLSQFFFERFLRDAKLNQFGYAAADEVGDSSPPYPMAATAIPQTGRLNDASARYTPLVWTPTGGKISQMQKVKGNYPLDGMTFSATQTGSFNVLSLELKQWNATKCAEMLAAAGVDPGKVILVPKTGMKNNRFPSADKAWGFPRSVAARPAV